MKFNSITKNYPPFQIFHEFPHSPLKRFANSFKFSQIPSNVYQLLCIEVPVFFSRVTCALGTYLYCYSLTRFQCMKKFIGHTNGVPRFWSMFFKFEYDGAYKI